MIFGPHNFLTHIKNLVMGDPGFIRDVTPRLVVSTMDEVFTSDSLPIDAIRTDADGEIAIASIKLPRDYDEQTDFLEFHFRLRLESGTSIAVQGSAASSQRGTAAPAAISGFSAPTATTVDGEGKTHIVSLSGLGLKGLDIVHVKLLSSGRTANGIAHLIGSRASYRSTLVSYNETDSSGNPIR